jgi:hypothetical protein
MPIRPWSPILEEDGIPHRPDYSVIGGLGGVVGRAW